MCLLHGVWRCASGHQSTGWASDRKLPLYAESGRLTGQLDQLTLRTVLGQLPKLLGPDYVAPDAELEKVISVRLHKKPLCRALLKILALWDYAFTLNTAGNITTLHMMAKVSSELSLLNKKAKCWGPESPKQKVRELQNYGLAGHG